MSPRNRHVLADVATSRHRTAGPTTQTNKGQFDRADHELPAIVCSGLRPRDIDIRVAFRASQTPPACLMQSIVRIHTPPVRSAVAGEIPVDNPINNDAVGRRQGWTILPKMGALVPIQICNCVSTRGKWLRDRPPHQVCSMRSGIQPWSEKITLFFNRSRINMILTRNSRYDTRRGNFPPPKTRPVSRNLVRSVD